MAFKKKPEAVSDDTEDIEISPGGGNSFKDIVMLQLRKVTQLCCCEWRGGYYTMVPQKGGQEREVYVQDSREVFSNGVYALAIILTPKFDKDMDTALTNFKTKLSERQAKFIKDSSVDEEVILGESFYTEDKDKILLETYRNKKLKLHLSLFAELSKLLGRINYMELGGGVF